jgi:formate-dependent nitrite reductase membrane component NrfD
LQQSNWHGLIAAYLFLGGLGGGVMALGALADLFWQANDAQADRRPALFAGLAGMVALGVGSLILVLDLVQPLAAIFALSNFHSWITWGILFISLYFVAGILYVFPYLRKQRVAGPAQRVAGIAAGILGLLVSVYTGFLLSSSTGIPFWNTPALPLLFLVSGVSTGAALLMLHLITLKSSPFAAHTLHLLERVDLGLVAFELLILFAFINMASAGNAGIKAGAQYLLGSVGFTVGVALLGLLLPAILEAISIRKKQVSLTVAASVFVLIGGALLRIYVLQAGYFALPWLQ